MSVIETIFGRLEIKKDAFTLFLKKGEVLFWDDVRGPSAHSSDINTRCKETRRLYRITHNVIREALTNDKNLSKHPVVVRWCRELRMHLAWLRMLGASAAETRESERKLIEIGGQEDFRPGADDRRSQRLRDLKKAAGPLYEAWWRHRTKGPRTARKRKTREKRPISDQEAVWRAYVKVQKKCGRNVSDFSQQQIGVLRLATDRWVKDFQQSVSRKPQKRRDFSRVLYYRVLREDEELKRRRQKAQQGIQDLSLSFEEEELFRVEIFGANATRWLIEKVSRSRPISADLWDEISNLP